MSEPYAWTVVATVPEHPEKMPRVPAFWDRNRLVPAWGHSSSSWMTNGLSRVWVNDGPYKYMELVAGEQSAKTWNRHATAKAQATHARNCGFLVEIIPLYAGETDWKAQVERQQERIADLEAEIYDLKIESAKDRIYITQLEAAVRTQVAVENHHI